MNINNSIELLFLEGKGAKEISEKTGLNFSTVYARLRKKFGTGSPQKYISGKEIKRKENYNKISKDFVLGKNVGELSQKYGIHQRHIRRILLEQFGTASVSKMKTLKEKAKFMIAFNKENNDFAISQVIKILKGDEGV
jgi:hypothetical protein